MSNNIVLIVICDSGNVSFENLIKDFIRTDFQFSQKSSAHNNFMFVALVGADMQY